MYWCTFCCVFVSSATVTPGGGSVKPCRLLYVCVCTIGVCFSMHLCLRSQVTVCQSYKFVQCVVVMQCTAMPLGDVDAVAALK